jgi:hypothetical protein
MKKVTQLANVLLLMIFTLLLCNVNPANAVLIYASANHGVNSITIDSETGSETMIGSMGTEGMGIAIDNSDGTVYTIANSALGAPRTTQQLATVDPTTGAATFVGNPFADSLGVTPIGAIPALEIANNGTLYAGGVDSTFYSINTNTGDTTLIGSNSIYLVMDYAFDSLGTLWAAAGTKNELYTIDLATGNYTFEMTVTGIDTVGAGIMGIMFDENDVLYATNFADTPNTHLYSVDLGTAAATLVGDIGIDSPHGGDIYIAAVPEPSSLFLMLGGLAGIFGIRRKQNK